MNVAEYSELRKSLTRKEGYRSGCCLSSVVRRHWVWRGEGDHGDIAISARKR